MANEFVARKGIISLGGITYPVTNVSNTNYVITEADYFVAVDSGTVTVTLPSAVDYPGRILMVKNNADGLVTVLPVSGQTIDTDSSVTLDYLD